ncbi:MAG: L-histidine N(alpha)-methyltransferase [Pseudoxanthomonas sp.]
MESPSVDSGEFPTLYVANTAEPAPYHAALFHLQQGLAALQSLSPGRGAARRQIHHDLVALQQQVLSLLHIHYAPEDPSSGKATFGERLRQHRDEAGLTQEELASLSGLSASLIRKLEQGSKQPTRNALLCLCAVPELKLVPSTVSGMPASRDGAPRVTPNWYVPPGFDSVQMIADLAQQLNGRGGNIEQTYVYMDHKSALDWIALCNAPSYTAGFRNVVPFGPAVQRLREITGQVGLDVIALGSGDGKNEVRMVQQILEISEQPSIRFYLVDASQPLLSRAFKHAMDTLDDQSGVFVCGIQGNFHHLARYTQLHYTPARSHRRRVYTLFGGTMGSIEHEPQFFRSALVAAAPGDLLVLDISLAVASPENPKELWQRDPTLARPVPPAHERWLGGPLARYCIGVTDVKFHNELDTDRPIAGSYGIQVMAEVSTTGSPPRRFCMWNIRRYSLPELARCLSKIGWDVVGQFPFGGEVSRPAALLMFQRRMTTEGEVH